MIDSNGALNIIINICSIQLYSLIHNVYNVCMYSVCIVSIQIYSIYVYCGYNF